VIGLLVSAFLASRAVTWAQWGGRPVWWKMGIPLTVFGGALLAAFVGPELFTDGEDVSISLTYLCMAFTGVGIASGFYAYMRLNCPGQGPDEGHDYVESFGQLVWNRFGNHRLALGAAFLLIVLIDVSLLAEVIEQVLGVSHAETSLRNRYRESGWPHLLGTDDLGRDVFTRLVFGGQISLTVGLVSALSSATIGTLVGLLAGYFGGWVDSILMRFTDAMLAIPVLPLMIVFSALDLMTLFKGADDISGPLIFCACLGFLLFFSRNLTVNRGRGSRRAQIDFRSCVDGLLIFGFTFFGYLIIFRFINWENIAGGNLGSVVKIILIIVFFGWMTVARLARAAALQLKNLEFVTAARALGGRNRRILMVHILPNALAPIIVAATLEVGGNILYEAALSFLGLGVQPPVPSWGNMLNNALDYIKRDPLLAFWPGLLILVTVSCFNFFGDGMRDALDPHQVMKGK
jgi:peptide/nickel transport system permease protein